jgi:hypothetical protein
MREIPVKVIFGGVAALSVLAAGSPPARAADDGATVAQFIDLCSKPEHRDACADMLAEDELDSQAPCPAGLDAVLAELRRHPEWATMEWTAGVDAALKNVCRK